MNVAEAAIAGIFGKSGAGGGGGGTAPLIDLSPPVFSFYSKAGQPVSNVFTADESGLYLVFNNETNNEALNEHVTAADISTDGEILWSNIHSTDYSGGKRDSYTKLALIRVSSGDTITLTNPNTRRSRFVVQTQFVFKVNAEFTVTDALYDASVDASTTIKQYTAAENSEIFAIVSAMSSQGEGCASTVSSVPESRIVEAGGKSFIESGASFSNNSFCIAELETGDVLGLYTTSTVSYTSRIYAVWKITRVQQ